MAKIAMKLASSEREIRPISTNRRARYEFEITQTLECGIELTGTEVKSLRAGKANLQDAYATFKGIGNEELYVVNLHINEYEQGNRENHKPKRDRRLLVHKRESVKLQTAVQEKGMTLIPLSLYFSGHLVKLELGVARAKKKYDKRESTKERETQRELHRKFKL